MKRIISFLCFLAFNLFMSVTNCLADKIDNEFNNDFSNELQSNDINNKNKDKTDIPKASNEDIFGDEQAFPFIAGLGKNAAH